MKKLKKIKNTFPPELVNCNGVKIKVYFNGHMIGAGKMQLIQLINLKGSISAAAKNNGYEYQKSRETPKKC